MPPDRTGFAGGALNTAMEWGPTVIFAALLTVGGEARSPAATAIAFTVLAALTNDTNHTN